MLLDSGAQSMLDQIPSYAAQLQPASDEVQTRTNKAKKGKYWKGEVRIDLLQQKIEQQKHPNMQFLALARHDHQSQPWRPFLYIANESSGPSITASSVAISLGHSLGTHRDNLKLEVMERDSFCHALSQALFYNHIEHQHGEISGLVAKKMQVFTSFKFVHIIDRLYRAVRTH